EEILEKPWKYLGYRAYSEFLASDDTFLVFRKFGTLHARVLLVLQDEISQLEARLEDIDTQHSRKAAKDIHNGSFRREEISERTQILHEVHEKLKEYSEQPHATLRSRPKVPQADINSLHNWLANTQKAIYSAEVDYLNEQHDLFSLVPVSTTPLRRFFERSASFRLARIWRKKTPSHAHVYYPYPDTLHFTSDARVDGFVAWTITVLGMAMLIAPLWVLAITPGMMKRLGVITGFVVLFITLVTGTTSARPFESLAAAAAYSAVLVVFLQTGG
ncbi:hypothetical protein B0J11DRAFT_409503, partial [Dendryphion nanum]